MGSRTVQHYSNQYLNNDAFALAGITDVFTTAANVNNGGLEGLYIFKTPAPSTTPNAFGESEEEQGSPWDWWDNATYGVAAEAVNGFAGSSPAFFEANAILGNPNMSAANGNAYLDTVQGYLNPRMYETLDLTNNSNVLGIYGCTDVTACNYDATANSDDGSCLTNYGCMDATACNYDASATCDDGLCELPNGCGDPLYVEYDASVTCSDPNACITLISTGINEVIDASTDIYPNPANNSLNIVSNSIDINTISIYSLNGKEVLNTIVNANQIKINTSNLANGLYIIDIKYNNTTLKRKLIIE